MKQYLREKRRELLWAMSEQDYTQTDLAQIFGSNTSVINRIIKSKPKGWKSPWYKRPKFN